MRAIAFAGSGTAAEETRVNAQKIVNLYPVIEGAFARSGITMVSTPGLKPYRNGPSGACRSNGTIFKGKAYFAHGQYLISIDQAGAMVTVGTLNTTAGRVVLDSSRTHVALTDGVNGYYFDGTTFGVITDIDFPVCDWITCIRGFWVACQAGTDSFFVSTVDDPTSWAALGFASAERKPDAARAVVANGNTLWVLGDTTIEVFVLTGNAYFPFEPATYIVINWGVHAPHSIAQTSDSIYLLGKSQDGGFAVLELSFNSGMTVISSPDITAQIEKLERDHDISDAIGMCMFERGSLFYVLTFPSADVTWVYDKNTKVWHERKSPGIGRWQVNGHVYLGGLHIVGDFADGQYYTLDKDYYLDGALPIERLLRTGFIFDPEGKALHHSYIEVEYAPGVGLAYGDGADPVVRIRWSDDGGYTWSNGILLNIGKTGERNVQVKARRLGMALMRVYEFLTVEPVPITILNAYVVVK